MVKVEIIDSMRAHLTTKDKTIDMIVPARPIMRRFPKGEVPRVSYFSETVDHDVVELGDRIDDPGETW